MQPQKHIPLQVLSSLSLDLVCEIEVSLVKLVNSNVTILTSRGISLSLWVDRNSVLNKYQYCCITGLGSRASYQRTKVTTNTANLLLKDLVIKSSFEFTLSRRGSSDVHSGLTTSQDDEVFFWCNRCTVERGIGNIGLHDFEIGSVDELCSLVF